MQIKAKQDRHFPAYEKLIYDNYLVAVNKISVYVEFWFTLRNGANCALKESGEDWTRIQLNKQKG